MLKSPRLTLLGLGIAAAIFLFDQWSKYWLIESYGLLEKAPVKILPFFNVVVVWNRGVSFGMFQAEDGSGRLILIGIAALICFVLCVWLSRVQVQALAIAIGAIMGGAVGNVVDRVRFGAVFDFLDVHVAGYHWPAFNVADSAICIGVAWLCIDSLWLEKKRQHLQPSR